MFSAPSGPEGMIDEWLAFDEQNHAGVLVAEVVPTETGGPIPVVACSSGVELGTCMDTCLSTQVNQPARSAPSASHSHHGLEMGPKVGVFSSIHAGVTLCVDGLAGLGDDAPDIGCEYETGDDGIATEDWLDVTHAMLDAIEGPNHVSR